MANVNSAASASSAAETFAAINDAASGSKTGKASASSDMATGFLTLLTTQLKNQDPLNPLDNAQMTSQLAQINTVNGIEKLNATLGKLLTSYSDTQAMQAAGMIGKQVMVAGSEMALVNGQAAGGIKLDGPADSVVLTIKDSAGKVVQAQNLGSHAAGSFTFVWDGKNEAGDAVPNGNYKFTVEALQGGNKITSTSLQVGTVSAVTRSNQGFLLDLGASGSVDFNNVQQIL